METMAEACPNCGKLTNTTQTRLIKDSCGHTKCRLCLLHEEYGCKSCDNEKKIQQIGNFDYPIREFSKLNSEEDINSGSSFDNSTSTECTKLLINKLTNNFEFLPCGISAEDVKKTEFAINSEIVPCGTENDEIENDDWTLKIVEENDPLEKDDIPVIEDNEKVNIVKTRRKIVDRSHITILPGSPERYKCDACGKIFRNKKGTCYHDSCVTGIRPYQCTLCNRSFVKRSHFEYHERAHTGYKPFKCTLCDKAFIQNNKLNRHMLSHSKLRPFTCNNCGKSYRKKDDLKSHMTLHSSTPSTSYPCKICGKSFRVASNLKRHILIHSDDRPHVCDKCNKGFKDRSLLKRHKLIHDKERPFSCAECSRYFLSKCELRRHITTHSNEKPFACEFCKTYFRRKDNLNRHIRHHHSENSCENTSLPSNTNKTPSKKPKKMKKPTISSNSKNLNKESMDSTNSLNQINSRLDSMGNITPVIRTTGELSNAVPVINGPISIKKFVESTETRKKTFTYIEPIPLAEAVDINKRIEEKLYQQNTSSNFFFRNYSTPSRSNVSNINHKNDYEKASNQFDKTGIKLNIINGIKIKEFSVNNETDVKNLNARPDKGNLILEQRANLSKDDTRNFSSKNVISCSERVSDSKFENVRSTYVSIIKKHVIHSQNKIESGSGNKNSEEKEREQKPKNTHWRRRTAETLKPNFK